MFKVSQLHLGLISSRWVGLWSAVPACLPGARIWPVVGLLTGDFLRPKGTYSQAFTSVRGVGLLPGAPNKGNADGAEGIFGHVGRVWASALRPDTP